eukprot:760158-Hanusia_phi.AAC.2
MTLCWNPSSNCIGMRMMTTMLKFNHAAWKWGVGNENLQYKLPENPTITDYVLHPVRYDGSWCRGRTDVVRAGG